MDPKQLAKWISVIVKIRARQGSMTYNIQHVAAEFSFVNMYKTHLQ